MPGWVVFSDGDGLQAAGGPRIDSTDVGLRVFLLNDGHEPLLRLCAGYMADLENPNLSQGNKMETSCDFPLPFSEISSCCL